MFSSVQSLSRVQLFVTPWTATGQASLSFAVFQSLLKFMSIKWVMLSNHLILLPPSPLPSILPSIKVFSNKLALRIRWPKYWSFYISLFTEYSGLISFRIDFRILSPCCPRESQESFPTPLFESICGISLLYDPNLTSVHDYWKNYSFDSMDHSQQSDVSAF